MGIIQKLKHIVRSASTSRDSSMPDLDTDLNNFDPTYPLGRFVEKVAQEVTAEIVSLDGNTLTVRGQSIDLASTPITGEEIEAGAITSDKIQDGSIDSTKLQDGAVGVDKINSGAFDAAPSPGSAKLVRSGGVYSAITTAVQTMSARFRGFYATWADVPSEASGYPQDEDGNRTPDSNDYISVGDMSGFPTGSSDDPPYSGAWLLKYTGNWEVEGKNGWHPEFQYNEEPLTPAQQAALDSGITAEKVRRLDSLPLEVGGDSTAVRLTVAGAGENKATKPRAVALGYGLDVSGNNAFAANNQNTASGENAAAFGYQTSATGRNAISENYNTTASGTASHAEGNGTKAIGGGAHAEGSGTEAGGNYSHTEGTGTKASALNSHAEGALTEATKAASHAEGRGTKTTNPNEHAEGQWNSSHTDTISTVGIGTSDTDRRNAVETMTDGKTYVYGLGGYDGTNPTAEGVKDLATVVETILSRIANNETNITSLRTTVARKADETTEQKLILADKYFPITGTLNGTPITFDTHDGMTIEEWSDDAYVIIDGHDHIIASFDRQSLTFERGMDVSDLMFHGVEPVAGTSPVLSEVGGTVVRSAEFESISALVASKAAKSDTVLSENSGYTRWVCQPATYEDEEVNLEQDAGGGWFPVVGGDEGIGTPQGDAESTRLEWAASDTLIGIAVVATRERLPGYVLGSQTDKLLASEEEAEALRTDVAAKLDGIVATSHTDLLAMRDAGQLKPGQQYRITDYVATTTGDMDSQSANHPFDLIVTADDARTLNEHARAALHDGDDYFANCDLAAWDVWYCIDNDTSRFAWAVAANGKGVIYRLVDEFGNDCPYDFKGLQFKPYDTSGTYHFTFDSGSGADYSRNGWDNETYENRISPYIDTEGPRQRLNNIVFRGGLCWSNTFGINCYHILFEDSCFGNTLKEYCHSNTFGGECSFTSFGCSCSRNRIDRDCIRNTFGERCSDNILSTGCYNNTFGDNCTNNQLDFNSTNNIFGNTCTYNIIGEECHNNTFGNACSYIKFGNASTVKSFLQFIRIGSGNTHLYINPTGTISDVDFYQNVEIKEGVNNTTTYKTIDDPNVGQTFLTTYKPTNSQEISI